MKCEQEGCKERASGEWRIEGYDPVPVFHFCDEHAAKFGFCTSCGAWSYRTPKFMGTDEMWDCDKCGNTSCYEREGRPYSNRSRQWDRILEWFRDTWTDIPHWDWDTVVTEPPMKDLDWQAIEAWYRSHNIYRVFLSPPQIDVIETEPNHFQVTVNP